MNREELLAAWLEGEIDAHGEEHLMQALRGDREFARLAAEHLQTRRLLAGLALRGGDFQQELQLRLQAPESIPDQSVSPGPLVSLKPQGLLSWGRRTGSLAALLAVSAGVLFFISGKHPAGGPGEGSGSTAESESAAAPVDQFATVSNADALSGISIGQRIPSGPLKVLQGLVELTFDCGAVVQLTAPAELDLQSEYRAALLSGKLTAQVPPQALGFIVLTPHTRIRDLGTSFGVEVRPDGHSELHVLEGEVEASASGMPAHQPVLVKESQAWTFSADTMQTVGYNKARFQSAPELQSPPQPAPAAATHWSFDRFSEDGFMDAGGKFPMQPRQLTMDGSALVPRESMITVGRFGNALRFDGNGHFASTSHAGLGGSSPRTVAFWLRLPIPQAGSPRNCMLGWGASGARTKWEMLWNQDEWTGQMGALRLEFGQGYVVGSTNLKDGQWHHVAIVYHGEEVADVTTHIKLYVDGRLETLTGRRPQRIFTDISSAGAMPLTLGRYIDARREKPDHYFQGDIDDLHIIDGALPPSAIQQLFTENRLP